MKIDQLKLMADPLRELLQQSGHNIGHNQSLDLLAALPGLRNWPEVQSFPERTFTLQLDGATISRLSFRIKKKFGLDIPIQDLIVALSGRKALGFDETPQIWPSGPMPGVYVTVSQDAIDALLAQYEEETDGALVFAERAGSHWENSIDLGEYGLWSSGIARVPSGTLFVLGPIQFNQQHWKNSSERLQKACLNALTAGHRVAVLVDTWSPESVCEDVNLMVRSDEMDEALLADTLLGVVSDSGKLQRKIPFSQSRPQPVVAEVSANPDVIPQEALSYLRKAINKRKAGFLIFGSEPIKENSGLDLVAASLSLTEHVGPAARIVPRFRSTPEKDWMVPEPIKSLPYLPSIESAYEQGYRRLIINPTYTDSQVLLEYGVKSIIISGTYTSEIDGLFMRNFRTASDKDERTLLSLIIGILGVKHIQGRKGFVRVSDLYVPQSLTDQNIDGEHLYNFLMKHRILKWEDQLTELLDAGTVSSEEIEISLSRNQDVKGFLSKRK